MRTLSLIISYLFHPVFLPTAGLVIIFSLNSYVSQTTPLAKQAFIIGWIFVNTAIIPFLFTAFLRWKKLITSIQLESREDRIVPFSFALFFYLTNYYLMHDMPLPGVIYSLFLGSSIAVGLALVFTFFTKISIHMIGMGGATAAIYGVGQMYHLPIMQLLIGGIIASGLVGSARFILESHNLRQIYMGWFIGFLTVYVPLVNGWG